MNSAPGPWKSGRCLCEARAPAESHKKGILSLVVVLPTQFPSGLEW